MSNSSTRKVNLHKVAANSLHQVIDSLAVEEPLEIRIEYGSAPNRILKNISVTMRTPGNDSELACGFLFTEGIIKSYEELAEIKHLPFNENVILVKLKDGISPELNKLERNFYTTSSCGVCGKSSIDSIRQVSEYKSSEDKLRIFSELLFLLPETLRKSQSVFDQTGGLHASALFDLKGNLIDLREDVGRHNALDKLIGAGLEKKSLPLADSILLLSGRASFELIQKAVMAGIKIIAAVGAPSSLAVELAKEFNITLLGFLRDSRFNIYCGEQRISEVKITE